MLAWVDLAGSRMPKKWRSLKLHKFQHKELLFINKNIVFVLKGIFKNNLLINKEVWVSSDGLLGPLEIFVLKEVPCEEPVIKATLAGPLFLLSSLVVTRNPGEF